MTADVIVSRELQSLQDELLVAQKERTARQHRHLPLLVIRPVLHCAEPPGAIPATNLRAAGEEEEPFADVWFALPKELFG